MNKKVVFRSETPKNRQIKLKLLNISLKNAYKARNHKRKNNKLKI